MPSYVVFSRTPGFSMRWTEVAKETAKHELDAWYAARWKVRGNDCEVIIREVGFFNAIRGKYQRPSDTESGLPPYTDEEREAIASAAARSKTEGAALIRRLNERRS